jgi:hypothetical protein
LIADHEGRPGVGMLVEYPDNREIYFQTIASGVRAIVREFPNVGPTMTRWVTKQDEGMALNMRRCLVTDLPRLQDLRFKIFVGDPGDLPNN